ncbi:MAG: enoyl-CoA hydratase/isomerase family protein [Novosphingobium sp.]|nr:enoyl-CoA hydratase/isomerase family protein [Novosphingobium sp.]MCP5403669.1 enoyl-CoA hydratase/isomerase family protein [Novosphingobium sp.]
MAQAPDEPPVLAEVADGVMTVTLNRPGRGNGWNGEVARAYFGLLEDAARSPEVRAIVLTGAGKSFCIGGDGQKLDEATSSGNVKSTAQRAYWFPLQVGKPIIGAINGACFGIGLQQALCCDIRIAADDAKFSTAYARRGLVAEMGMSWLLPRIVGTGNAMDMLLSARLVRAEEARDIGLVNRVVAADALVAEARAYARQLAEQCSPRSMQAVKRQCYRDLMGSLFESYERSVDMLDDAVLQEDFREGIRSWQENRAPAFPPLPEDLALIDLEK